MNSSSNKKIRFSDNGIAYRKGFKWVDMPFTEIVQAYMRVEEVKGKMCCGVANFDMHFLMLKTKAGELIKIGVLPCDQVKEMLEKLRAANAQIEIGYKK